MKKGEVIQCTCFGKRINFFPSFGSPGRRQLEEYTFTKFEAGDVVKRFFKHMDKYLMKADQVTSTELSSFLEDAMDHVVEETRLRMERDRATEASRSSAARSSAEVEPPPVPAFSPVRRTRGSTLEPTPASAAALGSSRGSARMAASPPSGKGFGGREKFAGMAIGEKDDPQGDITLDLAAGAAEAAQQGDDPSGDISPKSNASSDSELAAPLEEEIAEPRLPLVDPFEDHDNVWVMLDEGCNQTCHGTQWRRHSEGVLAGYGLQFLQQKAAGTSFKGIGAAKAVGKYSMPFALLISNGTGRRRDIRLQGELASTELDSPDVLCLLSLQDQVQLGLVKDLRKGTAKGVRVLRTASPRAPRADRPFAPVREPVWGERHGEAPQVRGGHGGCGDPQEDTQAHRLDPCKGRAHRLDPCKGRAYLDPSGGRGSDSVYAVRARARQGDAPQEGPSGDVRSRETGVLTSFAKSVLRSLETDQ